ncbi:MAG: class I SAM-dependent methyltransferase [Microbacteriaceae bacterium]
MADGSGPRRADRVDLHDGDWLELNRALWDELVPIHVASAMYDQSDLRAGRARLLPMEQDELAQLLPDGLAGIRVLHLQCHFGGDSLAIAQQGAGVVGIDFSKPAILHARELAREVGLDGRARFVHANVYDARHILPEPESFDLVYTTWGTVGWLPDLDEWARIIAWYLKPGGALYFADGHPTAHVFDSSGSELPNFRYAYDSDGVADVVEESDDYADETVTTTNTLTHEWMHPLAEIVTSLQAAGLSIEFLHEHYEVPWKMYDSLVDHGNGLYGWPGKKWLPLGLSIGARA